MPLRIAKSGASIATFRIIDTDSDAFNFLTAAGITNTTQRNAINKLVIDLKYYGLWTKMKALYPVVGGTSAAHAVNLRTPGTYNLSFTAGWVHSSTGMTPNGSSDYAETKIIPSSVLTLNSTHLSFYSRTNANPGGLMGGVINTTQGSALQASVYGTNNGSIFDCYNSTSGQGRLLGSNVADSRGFAVFSRSSSSSSKIFWNNSQNGAITTTGGALPNTYSLLISARKSDGVANGYDIRQCAFASIGDGLTDQDAINFYNIVQQYQINLGRQV